MGAKKLDGTALTLTTKENVSKKTYDKRFAIPLDFDFFKHHVHPYGLKEDLAITIELNSTKEGILCTGDTNAVYKISDIILEYDATFDDLYATCIGKMYIRGMSIPCTRVTSIRYQALSKKTLSGRLTLIIFLFGHCEIFCYYFLINTMTLLIKMNNFTIQTLRKF